MRIFVFFIMIFLVIINLNNEKFIILININIIKKIKIIDAYLIFSNK